ncbi:hypothetical protein J2T13_000122 [Paenibacillus sp. DS2015]|uniref:YqzE family protein n=1 Tax=Paenibacillus sp. DS2015 TaxID=3373917 RepID=UPI003D207B42
MADDYKLVKYITEQVVIYMETPKQQASVKETWSTKWFGMIPISLALLRDKSATRSESEQQAEELDEYVAEKTEELISHNG